MCFPGSGIRRVAWGVTVSIEVRSVQRLGLSSIVVTLPKPWARRLGLEPGKKVMLVDEGNSIRILPLEESEQGAITLHAEKIDLDILENAPLCVYLSGLDSVKIVGSQDPELIVRLQRKAMDLMGMHVSPEGDAIVLRVLLDPDKIDLSMLIKSLDTDVRGLLSIIRKAIEEGKITKDELSQAKFLVRNFFRKHFMVQRYLGMRYPLHKNMVSNYQVALASSYTGFAVDMLNDLVQLLAIGNLEEMNKGEGKDLLINMIDNGIEIFHHVTRLMTTPSVKRLSFTLKLISETRNKVKEALSKIETPLQAAVLIKLSDAIRLVNIATYVLLCKILLEQASTG